MLKIIPSTLSYFQTYRNLTLWNNWDAYLQLAPWLVKNLWLMLQWKPVENWKFILQK